MFRKKQSADKLESRISTMLVRFLPTWGPGQGEPIISLGSVAA